MRIPTLPTRLAIAFALSTSLATATLAEDDDQKAAENAERLKTEISKLATEGPKPKEITPPTPAELQESINRGVDFLLADQRPDGRWGSAERTKGLNIYASVPGSHHGFRLAVTGLALAGLCDVEASLTGERAEKVAAAIDLGTEWILKNHAIVRRADPTAIYNTWGHAYGISGLVRLYHRAEGDAVLRTRLKDAIQTQVDKLERYTFVNGGWGYYDFDLHTKVPGGSPNSFTTATGLVALYEAKQIGVDTYPKRLIKRSLDSVERQRNPDFTFAYGEYLRMSPRRGINRPGGSLGRSQACNLALRLYGDKRVTDAVLKAWLNRLYARNGWLDVGRKRPVPHESHFAVAGYFYYYGHFYAAMCIEQLPEAQRPYFQDHMAKIILPLQERDGSWWDYPFYNYHQQYGTAMALFILARCDHETPKSVANETDAAKTAMR
ncbi:MAG: hypothetical protein AAGJ46_04940 [Planctomycetota bacterium]